MGSVLVDAFDFRTAMDCIGFTALFFMILYFFFCGRFSIFRAPIENGETED